VRFGLLYTYWDGSTAGEADSIGKSLAISGRFADPFRIPTGFTAHVPPFYPFLSSLVFSIFGTGEAGSIARCVLNVCAYSVLYACMPALSVRLGLPRAAGLLAGLIMALTPIHKRAEFLGGWDEPYSALALAGLLAWTIHLWQGGWRSYFAAAAYGLAWGLLFHSSTTTALTYAGLAVAACLAANTRPRALKWWLAASLASVLVVIPWTIRNHSRMGSWFFMRSNLGLELQQAYNDLAQPTIALNNHSGSTRTHPLYNADVCREIIAAGEVQFNRIKLAESTAWIRANPLRFAELTVGHFAEFWFAWREEPAWIFLIFSATSFLGLAGLWHLNRNGGALPARVLAIAWLTYPTVYYFFQYVNRYRAVIDWSFTLMAAYWVYETLQPAAPPRIPETVPLSKAQRRVDQTPVSVRAAQ
jgi:4-amino-4-deoxy-L-arabinose transferase-like glycosyltransferase